MNISQLKYFLALVKFGSFSNAADDTHISQSSMSKQIKSLENELGTTLFVREHSKVFLTKAGEEFLKYARQSVKSYDEMLLAMEELTTADTQTVKIGSIPVVSAYNLTNKIAEFVSLHPKDRIVIDLMENTQYSVFKALTDDSIDIALLRTEYMPNRENYDYIRYVEDNFVLVCRKDNNLSRRESMTLEEVARHPLAILDASSMIHTITLNAFKSKGIPYKIRCMTTRHKVLMEILQKDSGVSLMPERLVDLQLFPHLTTIPLVEPIISEVALIKDKGKRLTKITKMFWDYMRENPVSDALSNRRGEKMKFHPAPGVYAPS
jgi:DNA-binding transcriptional LysR family regulator